MENNVLQDPVSSIEAEEGLQAAVSHSLIRSSSGTLSGGRGRDRHFFYASFTEIHTEEKEQRTKKINIAVGVTTTFTCFH